MVKKTYVGKYLGKNSSIIKHFDLKQRWDTMEQKMLSPCKAMKSYQKWSIGLHEPFDSEGQEESFENLLKIYNQSRIIM